MEKLQLYRRALRLASALPSAGIRDITKSSLRALAQSNEDTAALRSRVSALRAMLPRRLWPERELRERGALSSMDSIARTVNRERRSARVTRGTGVHADDLARHRKLIERMQFRGSYWQR